MKLHTIKKSISSILILGILNLQFAPLAQANKLERYHQLRQFAGLGPFQDHEQGLGKCGKLELEEDENQASAGNSKAIEMEVVVDSLVENRNVIKSAYRDYHKRISIFDTLDLDETARSTLAENESNQIDKLGEQDLRTLSFLLALIEFKTVLPKDFESEMRTLGEKLKYHQETCSTQKLADPEYDQKRDPSAVTPLCVSGTAGAALCGATAVGTCGAVVGGLLGLLTILGVGMVDLALGDGGAVFGDPMNWVYFIAGGASIGGSIGTVGGAAGAGVPAGLALKGIRIPTPEEKPREIVRLFADKNHLPSLPTLMEELLWSNALAAPESVGNGRFL